MKTYEKDVLEDLPETVGTHTPEPWEVTPTGLVGCIRDPKTTMKICEVMGTPEIRKADARRIVACVNACAGIPTNELTVATLKRHPLDPQIRAITEQRDALLAALRDVLYRTDSNETNQGARQYARSVIAAVESGKVPS